MISNKLNDLGEVLGYLRWCNSFVGIINKDYSVNFINPNLNKIVSIYTKGMWYWSKDNFNYFLMDRLISSERRDIDKLILHLGISKYNIFDIAFKTKAFNLKDKFWISIDINDNINSLIDFSTENLTDELIYSPDGVNEKHYGFLKDKCGLYKKRLNKFSTDLESEIAVSLLATKLGIKCCKSVQLLSLKEEKVFSEFLYDFNKETLIHARIFLNQEDRELYNNNEYHMLIAKFPSMKEDIVRMIILDFITRQTDRHWSNFSIKIDESGIMSFYPLYDNGRSLFFEDSEIFINNALNDIQLYSSEFGIVGTYFDYVNDISNDYKISNLIDLNISEYEVYNLYEKSGLTGHRLSGATKWTVKTLDYLRTL